MILFVINPVSGNGKSLQVWKRLEPILQKRAVPYRASLTEYAGHGVELARQAAEEAFACAGSEGAEQPRALQAVVAVGGDGTVHEVVNGVAAFPELPVGFIPSGSGNDFSRGFGGVAEPEEALERILAGLREGRAGRYDLGRYELGAAGEREEAAGRRGFFINAIGVGFDGEVARVTNASWYKRFLNRLKLGSLAYVLTVFRLLFRYQTHRVELTVDRQRREFDDVWLLSVSNIPYYGGGMKIAPDAKPDDGEFQLCIVHGLSRLKLLVLFGTVFQGKHVHLPEVTLLTGRSVDVQSDRPMTIHGDGEILGTTPVQVRMLAGQRTIL